MPLSLLTVKFMRSAVAPLQFHKLHHAPRLQTKDSYTLFDAEVCFTFLCMTQVFHRVILDATGTFLIAHLTLTRWGNQTGHAYSWDHHHNRITVLFLRLFVWITAENCQSVEERPIGDGSFASVQNSCHHTLRRASPSSYVYDNILKGCLKQLSSWQNDTLRLVPSSNWK